MVMDLSNDMKNSTSYVGDIETKSWNSQEYQGMIIDDVHQETRLMFRRYSIQTNAIFLVVISNMNSIL